MNPIDRFEQPPLDVRPHVAAHVQRLFLRHEEGACARDCPWCLCLREEPPGRLLWRMVLPSWAPPRIDEGDAELGRQSKAHGALKRLEAAMLKYGVPEAQGVRKLKVAVRHEVGFPALAKWEDVLVDGLRKLRLLSLQPLGGVELVREYGAPRQTVVYLQDCYLHAGPALGHLVVQAPVQQPLRSDDPVRGERAGPPPLHRRRDLFRKKEDA